MIICIFTGKVFEKMHHMLQKVSKQLGIQGNFLNLIKDIYEKDHS